MGKHQKWRKLAKKLRRKRIRQEKAKKKTELEEIERKRRESSPTYVKLLEEQKKAELFQKEEESRLAKERELKWLKDEEEAQRQWRELQAKLATLREERAKEEERILQEWKREQEVIKKEKERIKQLKEENERKLQVVSSKIEEFISNGGEIPEELNITIETNPNKPSCPFFQKTGACRFKDICSRNHIRPGVSKILLLPCFYSHFSLEQSSESEYGSDLTLEYDDRETYYHFREFFHDVLPEFEKYGRVNQFKVCCNKEPHLRGNVYVEYESTRAALRAYKIFQGRWYGGKQLNVEFCTIPSWKAAICGLSFRRQCPKGSSCNFLHVFMNPGKMFQSADRDLHRNDFNHEDHDFDSSSRKWRWSESPESDRVEKENHRHMPKHSGRKNWKDYRKDRKSSKTKSRSRRSSSPSHKRRKRKRS